MILTILILTVALPVLFFLAFIPPAGDLAAVVMAHPFGWVLAYGVSTLIAVAVVYHQRKKAARGQA